MGVTSFKEKHLPHLTPVVLTCATFVAANASGPMIIFLERMQAKSKAEGLDWFDLAITLVFIVGIVGSTILAFRSRAYTVWADQRAELKKKTETEWVRSQIEESERIKPN